MKMYEVLDTIKQHQGEIQHGINWTWAYFPSKALCKECFAKVEPHIEHRGIYPPHLGSPWSFRFR